MSPLVSPAVLPQNLAGPQQLRSANLFRNTTRAEDDRTHWTLHRPTPELSVVGIMQAQTRHVEACVAHVFNVRHESLRASTRGKAQVALARQVAMYVCHTSLAYSLTTVGHLFDRDRTTVGHACRLVEDLRDDSDFDTMMMCLERVVLSSCTPFSKRVQLTA